MTSPDPAPSPPPRREQRGSATLFISVMLVVLVTLSSVYALRSVLFEQKDSSNHYWATQAHEAAQSGIEHALAWLDLAYADGIPATFNGPIWDQSAATHCPAGIAGNQWQCLDPGLQGTVAGHAVDVRIVRNITAPNVAWLFASASHASNGTQAALQHKAYTPFGVSSGNQAPLVVNGCIGGTTGTPDICPANGVGSPCPEAAAGSTPGTSVLNLWLRDLNGDGQISAAEKTTCLDTGHLDLHDGAIQSPALPLSASTCNPALTWATVVGSVTPEVVKGWSDAQAAAGMTQDTSPKRTVYWIDSPQPFHDSLGSADEPALVVFSALACATTCPAINGGPTIFGTVYLQTGCDSTKANGWGGGTVYGTVGVDSGMDNLNANTRLMYSANGGGALPPPLPPGADPARVQRLSGSWKDWR